MSNDPSSGNKTPSGFMSWANKHFKEAVDKVSTTVENYTSARNQYQVDLLKAETRVNGLRGKPGIDARFNAIDAELTNAKSAADKSDYLLANTHLAKVLSLHPDSQKQSEDYTWYQNNRTSVSDRLSNLRGHAGKRAITTWISEIETAFNAAEQATLALDHTLARSKLLACMQLHRNPTSKADLAEELADACESYDNELGAVEQRLDDLNQHVGHKAIAKERTEIDLKIKEAKAKANTNEFIDAYSLLLEALNLHSPEAEDIADKCETYYDKKTQQDNWLVNLKNRPQSAVATEEIAKIEADLLGITARADARQWSVLDGLISAIIDLWNVADRIRLKAVAYEADLVLKQAKIKSLTDHVASHKRPTSIAAEITSVNGAITKAKEHAAITKREYDEALQVMADIPTRCDAAKLIADACEKYESKLVIANQKLEAVKLLSGITKEIEAVKGLLQRAATLATNESRKFAEAEALLDTAIQGCTTATTLSGELGKFGAATGDALKLGTIKDAGAAIKQQVEAVRALLTQLTGLPAHDKVQKELEEIDKLIDLVPSDSKEKPDVAFKVPAERCNAANLAVRRIIDLGYAAARKVSIDKLTLLEARCKDTPLATQAAQIKTVTLAASDLKATTDDYSGAMELLAKINLDCAALNLVADKMVTYNTDRPGLETKVNDLEPKRQQLASEIDVLLQLLQEATTKATAGDFVVAVEKLEAVRKGLTLAEKLSQVKTKIATPPTNNVEFESLKTSCLELMAQPGGPGKVDAIVAALPEKTQRYVMMALMMARFDLTEFKQFKTDMIWKCHWGTCNGRNYKGDDRCRKCSKTRRYWTCAHAPCTNKNQWTTHCEACGLDDAGATNSDAKIESSYSTTNLVEDDYTKGNKSIKKLYEIFKLVPESQTKDNDKLKKIIRYKENTGGAAYGSDTIYMNCGKTGETGSIDYALQLLPGSPSYQKYFPAPDPSLPEGDPRRDVYTMDPKCQPKPGTVDPGKKKPYFDFATLHEIGHAVDDKKQFMAKNGGKDDYGGWIDYGGDVTKIAKIANDHFRFDQTYIEERLVGNAPSLPPVPTDDRNLTEVQWASLQTKVNDWCDGIKVNKNLWWDGSNSARLSIGGRVYQEAYEGTWVSYKLSARNKGIHGYQFRAPAEWFAEIYAAYHSKILKDDHPSASWLSKL